MATPITKSPQSSGCISLISSLRGAARVGLTDSLRSLLNRSFVRRWAAPQEPRRTARACTAVSPTVAFGALGKFREAAMRIQAVTLSAPFGPMLGVTGLRPFQRWMTKAERVLVFDQYWKPVNRAWRAAREAVLHHAGPQPVNGKLATGEVVAPSGNPALHLVGPRRQVAPAAAGWSLLIALLPVFHSISRFLRARTK
jgi:hypothetical protein